MRLLIDMNLTPQWVGYLAATGHDAIHWSEVGYWAAAGHDAIHWSEVGPIDAPDGQLMAWAAVKGRTLLTQDLDFGLLLRVSGNKAPSVVQIRAQGTLPTDIGPAVVKALAAAESFLESGALVTIEPGRSRVRVLPLG